MKKTANQQVKPLTYKNDDSGVVYVGGCNISELIKTFGSPLYIYDFETIHSVLSDFKNAFQNTDIHLMYASKAFMTKAICKIMQNEGVGLDCVSSGELYTAFSSGFDMKNVIFNGNNKTAEEISLALDWGVGLFSVDNFTEAKLLNKICENKAKTVNILLRITPGIECHTHEYIQTGHIDSKFGFDLTQTDEIIELIKNKYTNLNLKGLHAHVGSQAFQTDIYNDAVKVLMQEADRIRKKHGISSDTFNIGGGIGIKYTEEDTPVSLYEVAEVVNKALIRYSREYGIENAHLYMEPGRCIVGTAGITVYTAGSTKQVPHGRKYVSVDGGMADNIRPALYNAKYTAEVINTTKDKTSEKVTIAGKFCESGDVLITDTILPEIHEGDLICLFDTGAYCYSMSSNYNRVLKPSVILVKDGKAEEIVKKQTFEQLTESDVIPEMIK